jgi:tetratricopeptide (TPR) repeat protein
VSASSDPSREAIDQGKSLLKVGKVAQAIELLAPLARAQANHMELHGMLGNAYGMAGRWPEAIVEFRRTVDLAPAQPMPHFALGSALAHMGEVNEAILYFRNAIRLGAPDVHCYLGVALAKLGDHRGAARELRAAIQRKADDATAHWNLSLILLLDGNWKEGFEEYEWRLICDDFKEKVRKVEKPLWRGEDLTGKAILVHDEQGYGDAILFARYLPLLAERAAKVIVLCQKGMAPTMRSIPGVQHVLSDGEPCPSVHFHVPMGSLPRIFGTTPANVLSRTPYLYADPPRIAEWSRKLGPRGDRLRIGLAWQGNLQPDPARSIDPKFLSPLLDVEGVEFFSLQKEIEGQPAAPPPDPRIRNFSADLKDFAETAALIANLDQVITIDTAVSHLSAALGHETWMMLCQRADWRWLRDRRDSPWFPTMRMYRQSELNDWKPVIQSVAGDLKAKVAALARMKTA